MKPPTMTQRYMLYIRLDALLNFFDRIPLKHKAIEPQIAYEAVATQQQIRLLNQYRGKKK